MITNVKVLNDLLNKACEIITSLEGYANEHSHYPEHNRELQKSVDNFFNEVDMLYEEGEAIDGQYIDVDAARLAFQYFRYVDQVKQNIDKATEEGILRDTSDYNYMSKETFIQRMQTDADFAKQWG